MNPVEVMAKILELTELMSCDTKRDLEKIPEEYRLSAEKLWGLNLSHSGRNLIGTIYQKSKNQQTCNQRTLAGDLGISPQAVSETLKKLESSACILKVNGKQKNENLIILTDLGEEIAILLDKIIVNHANDVFASFSQEELEQLFVLLNKLLHQSQQ